MRSRLGHADAAGRRRRITALSTLPLALLLFGSDALANRQIAQNHNFIQAGSTAAGVCDVCHAAGGGAQGTQGQDSSLRAFRFLPGANDIARCSGNCHSAPSYPIEGITVNAPSLSHLPPNAVNQPRCFNATVGCHLVDTFWDCLDCHNQAFMQNTFSMATGNDSAHNASGIDKFRAMANHKHVNTYNTADLTLPANNSCLKCHGLSAGTDHPGSSDGTGVLVYPDSTTGHNAGDPLVPSDPSDPDYLEYQEFCLSCHDGRADAGNPEAIKLFNNISVPVMPRFDYNQEFTSGGPRNFPSGVPYLAKDTTTRAEYNAKNYFENNGHGRATSLNNSIMNLTCLEKEGTGMGCHTAHGTANAMLLDDAAFVASTPPVDNINELGSNVCMTCHPSGVLEAGSGPSKFHAWRGTGVLHAGASDSTVVWGAASIDTNMEVGTPSFLPLDAARILPFYAARDSAPTARLYYVAGTNDFTDNMWVACLTCHDPHGTADFYQSYDADTGTCVKDALGNCYQTAAMLRKFMTTIDFDDPLCSECHVKP